MRVIGLPLDVKTCVASTAVLDPRLQRAKMQTIHGFVPDPRHQELELQDVIVEPALVLVLQHQVRRRLLE